MQLYNNIHNLITSLVPVSLRKGQRKTFKRWIFVAAAALLSFFLILPYPAQAATNIPLTINLSEVVTVTGTPQISVDVGGVPRTATYSSGSGTNALTFTLSLQAGDVDLDGITISSPISLNGGTIKDNKGNDATLTFTPPNTANVKVNYPSLGMDFVYDADGRYTLNGTIYNDLSSFLSATGGSFTRASIGTYFDSTGTLQTATSGVPRFDYDPVTHAPKGILIEEQRTNLLQRSESLTDSYWSKTRTTISNDGTISPTGGGGAYKVETNDASSWQAVRTLNLSYTSGQSYTASVFYKSGSLSLAKLNIWTGSGDRYAIFDLSSGTISSTQGTTVTGSISPVGGGWYRCSISWVAPATTTTGEIQFRFPSDGMAVGQYFYVWGAQLEQGAFRTSYIHTTTATVTRATDLLTIPTGGWYNQTAGSFYNNIEWASPSGVSYPMFFRVDDTTANNRWNLYYSQSSNRIEIDAYNGATPQGYFGSNATTSGTIKAAAAQSPNNANAAFNGALQTLDTNWAPPVVTQLYLSGGSATNKWHKVLKYYPLRVSDAQLQLLTQ